MNMFGPVYAPAVAATTAVQNPAQAIQEIAVNTAVDAIQKALEPPSAEEKQRTQQEQARKAQEERDKQQEQAQEALRVAEKLRLTLTDSANLDADSNKADAQRTVALTYVSTGLGGDDVELALTDMRTQILERMEHMAQEREGALDTQISGLPGYSPELSEKSLRTAGVIRLSLDDDRQEPVTKLSDTEARVSVRLDFADGTKTRMELRYRKAENDLATSEQGPEIAGRIGLSNEKRLAA